MEKKRMHLLTDKELVEVYRMHTKIENHLAQKLGYKDMASLIGEGYRVNLNGQYDYCNKTKG